MAINPDAEQIKAAGGLLYRLSDGDSAPDILLIYRNEVWDLPKGKLEEDESIPECAVREVAEELGLNKQPQILADLGTTRHTYTIDDKPIEKETYWFVMSLNEIKPDFEPQTSEGITDVRWFQTEQALNKVGFENLRDVINRFTENLENLSKISH